MLDELFTRCTSNSQCIDINKVCDFRTDCSDKSDEANCPSTCNFEKGYCKWVNAQVGDHYDWIRNKGPTPSKFTGPSTDHTYNTSAGLCYFVRFIMQDGTGLSFYQILPICKLYSRVVMHQGLVKCLLIGANQCSPLASAGILGLL